MPSGEMVGSALGGGMDSESGAVGVVVVVVVVVVVEAVVDSPFLPFFSRAFCSSFSRSASAARSFLSCLTCARERSLCKKRRREGGSRGGRGGGGGYHA
jgi:hypothetical protein